MLVLDYIHPSRAVWPLCVLYTNVLQERCKAFYMRGRGANDFSVFSVLNMKYCSVNGCDNNTGKSGISFYSFPKDNHLKDEWVKFTNRSDWAPKPNSKICSAHFSPHSITANNHLQAAQYQRWKNSYASFKDDFV